jgi:hypothetical protein
LKTNVQHGQPVVDFQTLRMIRPQRSYLQMTHTSFTHLKLYSPLSKYVLVMVAIPYKHFI